MNRDTGNRFAWILLALAAAALFFELGRMDIVIDNEGQRATPAAEMLRSGDFVVPTINGRDYLTKPPLFVLAIAGVYRVTGVASSLTARIPTALCGLGLVLAVYLLFRRETGEQPARWAALALLASPYFLERARWAQLDVPLTFAVFLAIAALRRAWIEPSGGRRAIYVVASGIALGAAFMFKGPPALIFLWAAWVAHSLLAHPDPGGTLRTGIYWTLAALVIELLVMAARWAAPAAMAGFRFPPALIVLCLAWTLLAWRGAPSTRLRDLALGFAVIGIATALAAPWCFAVLMHKGWGDLSRLLDEQVVERTYTASRINWGPVYYYVAPLPALCAPWGFLFPFHFSRRDWAARPQAYRFSVILAWVSIAAFSLIAGKEQEYVLPAFPFLFIATGFHLRDLARSDALPRWMARWGRVWQRAVLGLVALGALGTPIYALVTGVAGLLQAEVALMAAAALALVWLALKHPSRRLAGLFAVTLIVIGQALIIRGFHFTGSRSPKALAQTCGGLVQAGHTVEASHIYPAFAFYAAVPIPIEMDPEKVRVRMLEPKPYYYLTREKIIGSHFGGSLPEGATQLTSAYTRKDLILLGNAPLPPSLLPSAGAE